MQYNLYDRNSSVNVDLDIGQIARSTQRISSILFTLLCFETRPAGVENWGQISYLLTLCVNSDGQNISSALPVHV